MPSLNKILLIGHLGRDPDLRQTTTGKSVANFAMATSEKRGGEDHTEWHRIVAWEKTAGYCAHYLHKGALVYVEGRIQTREWIDKEGQTRRTTEVVAQRVLGLKYEDRTGGADTGSEGQSPSDPPPSGESDLPF